jgi:hypothetical protein
MQLEVRRLFAVQPPTVDDAGPVRALVLQLSGPADWGLLSPVWQGVQADWGLPAPAIAVAGPDGYQLWFSVATPVPPTKGRAFLEALQGRYLAEVPKARVGLRVGIAPAGDEASSASTRDAARLPARQGPGGPWSAFVSPDLAPVFADEPWLEASPTDAGQADLLSRLSGMPLADFERVLGSLSAAPPAAGPALTAAPGPDPRGFLLSVMNDPSVALALRIEAAKALLPNAEGPRRQ